MLNVISLEGGLVCSCFSQCQSSFVSRDWLHGRGLPDDIRHNLLLQCIGPGPTGSIVFLMPLEEVDLASFDVSLGTDVFTYYNEVLISMTATAACGTCT